MSLFPSLPASAEPETPAALQPLAERMRPRTLDEFIGQEKLLGPGKPLRVQIESDNPGSMLFWGPPGCGKTTLARVIARLTKSEFISFSAVLSGIKEIKDVMADAERKFHSARRTIVFVDEVHRFNKSQQDAFLPYVEAGHITFIGATTENPSFEVISPLLSRTKVYILESLARMLESGEAPFYLARRMVRMASEDIGLAEPGALAVTLAAKDAFDFLGAPEGNLALAQAAVYLSLAPKSNAVYTAYGNVLDDVHKTEAQPVPLHIRNAVTGLMKNIGYGQGYKYAHNFDDKVTDMTCLPDNLAGRTYYQPTDQGFEQRLRQRLDEIRKIKTRSVS